MPSAKSENFARQIRFCHVERRENPNVQLSPHWQRIIESAVESASLSKQDNRPRGLRHAAFLLETEGKGGRLLDGPVGLEGEDDPAVGRDVEDATVDRIGVGGVDDPDLVIPRGSDGGSLSIVSRPVRCSGSQTAMT